MSLSIVLFGHLMAGLRLWNPHNGKSLMISDLGQLWSVTSGPEWHQGFPWFFLWGSSCPLQHHANQLGSRISFFQHNWLELCSINQQSGWIPQLAWDLANDQAYPRSRSDIRIAHYCKRSFLWMEDRESVTSPSRKQKNLTSMSLRSRAQKGIWSTASSTIDRYWSAEMAAASLDRSTCTFSSYVARQKPHSVKSGRCNRVYTVAVAPVVLADQLKHKNQSIKPQSKERQYSQNFQLHLKVVYLR